MSQYGTESSHLFQEPVEEENRRNRFIEEQQKLAEERRQFEQEKKEFEFKKKMEENRLAQEARLFEMKWKLLEEEVKKVAKDKRELESEKERYAQGQNTRDIPVAAGNYGEAGMFFSGVDNELALKKRYKELIKIFHPDNRDGDTYTLQEINRVYYSLKEAYSA